MKHSEPSNTKSPTKLSFVASYVVVAILVLVPFHAVLTTWAGSNFGHLDAWRLWKEVLLLPLGIYGAVLVCQKPPLLRTWAKSWLVRCILAYAALLAGYALFVLLQHRVTKAAVAYSLITNLRFLWWFLTVWAICDANSLVRRQWAKIVLAPAFVVVVFGVLQRFLLPADVLRHFGYGPHTIPAIETVDQKIDYRRIQSTLRGANPLGAYLIIPIMTAGAYLRKKAYIWLFLLLALATLFFTYSRSAELGLLVALAFFGWHNLANRRLRQFFVTTTVSIALLAGASVWLLRDSNTVQNTLFHTDETSQSTTSSNAQRLAAWRTATHDVVREPLGQGPGSAGPASARNNRVRIAESYYLQLGQEVGLLGMGLFVVVTCLVAYELWRRTDTLSRVLLASFVGLTVVNLLSHAWPDDTLSILWWGLAGAAMSAPGILNHKHHEQKAKTQKISAA